MATPVRTLSVVCPAYEEQDVLAAFHAELAAVLDRLSPGYQVEILYVDDGSRDGTLEVMRRLAGCDPRVRYLSLSRNFGKESALTAGLEHARGDVVITLDTDLQHPPALISTLLERWHEGNDIVLTLRQDDPHLSPFKKLTSHAYHALMRRLSDREVCSAASDYRLMSRKAVNALLQLKETHRFLRGMVSWLGFRTVKVGFQVAGRGGGVSKFTLRPLLRLAADGILSFSKVPLRLALVFGLAVLVVGLVYGVIAAAASLLGHPGPGWAYHAILLSLYLLGGCILCGLGVVGEYVGRIYEQVKARPLYFIKEVSPPPAAWHATQPADERRPEGKGFRPPAAGAEAA
jgi:dolichol-phosphate mannosyltransferase